MEVGCTELSGKTSSFFRLIFTRILRHHLPKKKLLSHLRISRCRSSVDPESRSCELDAVLGSTSEPPSLFLFFPSTPTASPQPQSMTSSIASPLSLSVFLLSSALYFAAVSSSAPGSKKGGGSAALEKEARKDDEVKEDGEFARFSRFVLGGLGE